MGILGDFICKDCGYRAPYSELAEAHVESQEAKGSSFRDMLKNFTCPQCGSTTNSETDPAKVKRMKLAGWIVLGIVIIALVYYLDLLEFIGL
jgi:predicted RNA-binding Zn-ribbon protein involved in translation (DUF1610 family)